MKLLMSARNLMFYEKKQLKFLSLNFVRANPGVVVINNVNSNNDRHLYAFGGYVQLGIFQSALNTIERLKLNEDQD